MIWAYARAPHIHLWSQPHELHWVAAGVVLIGFALVALGLATPNPARVGAEGLLSILPFAAIASGRNRFAPSEIRLWPVGAAALAYAALLAGHLQLFGVAPLAF